MQLFFDHSISLLSFSAVKRGKVQSDLLHRPVVPHNWTHPLRQSYHSLSRLTICYRVSFLSYYFYYLRLITFYFKMNARCCCKIYRRTLPSNEIESVKNALCVRFTAHHWYSTIYCQLYWIKGRTRVPAILSRVTEKFIPAADLIYTGNIDIV